MPTRVRTKRSSRSRPSRSSHRASSRRRRRNRTSARYRSTKITKHVTEYSPSYKNNGSHFTINFKPSWFNATSRVGGTWAEDGIPDTIMFGIPPGMRDESLRCFWIPDTTNGKWNGTFKVTFKLLSQDNYGYKYTDIDNEMSETIMNLCVNQFKEELQLLNKGEETTAKGLAIFNQSHGLLKLYDLRTKPPKLTTYPHDKITFETGDSIHLLGVRAIDWYKTDREFHPNLVEKFELA